MKEFEEILGVRAGGTSSVERRSPLSTSKTRQRDLKSFSAAKRAHYLRTILKPLSKSPIDWKKFHVVVFESDDWGFCGEVKDRRSIERLSSLGYNLEESWDPAALNNTLENEADLQELFTILLSYKDSLGRSPVFTANYVVTNPDFQRIKDGGFSEYYALPISSGFPGTWNSRKSLQKIWKLGVDKKVWMPEFHGYSHFNYKNWLTGLRNGDRILRDFFEEEMIASSSEYPTVSEYIVNYLQNTFADFAEQFSLIENGCSIFRSTFGYAPRSTIPPHDLWNFDTEKAFLKANLRFIQSERTKYSSVFGLFSLSFSSMANALQSAVLLFGPLAKLCRNVKLELTDPESSAIDISKYLFTIGSPAIVGTHRVNYVSGIDPNIARSGRLKLRNYLKDLTEDKHLIFLTDSELFQIHTRGYSFINYGGEILVRNYSSARIPVFKDSGKQYTAFDLAQDHEVHVGYDDKDSSVLHVPPKTTLSFKLDPAK